MASARKASVYGRDHLTQPGQPRPPVGGLVGAVRPSRGCPMRITTTKPQGSMALWIACPFGLLMPAACPPEAGQPDGTLQIRARDGAHLDQFRARWCPTLGPTIKTPDMDYDV